MKRLSDIDFTKTYGDVPESFQHRVQYALRQNQAPQVQKKKIALRTILLAAILTVLLGTAAYAAFSSFTAEWFGHFYGQRWKDAALEGDIAPGGQSIQIGDVVYSLHDVIATWIQPRFAAEDAPQSGNLCNYILFTGTIRPAAGANILLIPEDYPLSYPYGGLENHPPVDRRQEPPVFPEGTVSMLDKAVERDAVIRLATVVANGLLDENGEPLSADIGLTNTPQEDGSMIFSMEIDLHEPIPRQDAYTISIYIANWEVTREGEHLRSEAHDTRIWKDWIVTVQPEKQAK